MNRRQFLKRTSAAAGAGLFTGFRCPPSWTAETPPAKSPAPARQFEISLAQWSLNKTLFAGKMTNLDFPRVSKRDYGIETVEYVDQFFKDKARDTAYLAELRKRCEDEGVRSGLIMIDTAGPLGHADADKRAAAVENHKAWIDAARFLGCHSIRVNAAGGGPADELLKRIVESGSKLAEHGAKLDINVTIENHGGHSSDADWLARVMQEIHSPYFGTLPDFGNFPENYDRYAAVAKLMPFAKAVSAKTHRFDAAGNEAEIDYPRILKIVLDAGYRGYIGVESEGAPSVEEEPNHIRLTKALVEKFRAGLPVFKPIFNGKDLSGWVPLNGGDWSVEDGAILGRNGKDWSTDPAKAGSWLRTEREYGDFELFAEFQIKAKTNSGIFIRSGLERNPAFTGYEMQIYDDPASPPRKGGPGSLYDAAAPSKNRIRPAGEWNQARIIARGRTIHVHLNGELVVSHEGDRNLKGYIGLQNHDARSEVRFRGLQVAELPA